MTYIVKNAETGELEDILDIKNVSKFKKENPNLVLESTHDEAMLFEAFEDDYEDDFE